jgi:hypothetical protein
MFPRERDSRGQFIQSREVSKAPEADKVNKTQEANRHPLPISEESEIYKSDQATMGNSTQPADGDIPAPEDANPVKIYEFKTSTLTRVNIWTWKSNIREFYQTQGCWKVVKQTLRFLDSANKLRRLLENSKWAL